MDAVTGPCEECGSPLPTPAKVGRRRRYCSDTCRSAARRNRSRRGKGSALEGGPCATDIAGHSCGRPARFVVELNRRKTRLCGTCYDVAVDFFVSHGVSVRDVRTVRLSEQDEQSSASLDTTPETVSPVTSPLPPPRVLLIEDDEMVAGALRMLLASNGYLVSQALDGSTGLREAYAQRPDLVLLDIMLPGMDGIEVLRRLRSVSDVPVIFQTARSDDQDLVIGLAAGADDYIVKPFSGKELLARMARVLRRHGGTENQEAVYEDGVLRLDSLRMEVHVVGKPLELTPIEFRLLDLLVRNAGVVQPFGHLLATAWNDPSGEAATRVKFTVSRLRRKLEATPLGGDAIVSARGIGYFYRSPSAPRPSADAEAPLSGHGHAGRLLDILNSRKDS